ncbi:hypothetical protein [Corallococcus sp. 4LFB]|uniref:hypothetical protein n=1 Tax=Corallococcus sp. 4LFB TaxID=3383249 RepID=UPI0039765113
MRPSWSVSGTAGSRPRARSSSSPTPSPSLSVSIWPLRTWTLRLKARKRFNLSELSSAP